MSVILIRTPVQQEAHRAVPPPQVGLGNRNQPCAVSTRGSRSGIIGCLLMQKATAVTNGLELAWSRWAHFGPLPTAVQFYMYVAVCNPWSHSPQEGEGGGGVCYYFESLVSRLFQKACLITASPPEISLLSIQIQWIRNFICYSQILPTLGEMLPLSCRSPRPGGCLRVWPQILPVQPLVCWHVYEIQYISLMTKVGS